MECTGEAYFVNYPRSIRDMMRPHKPEDEHKYKVAKEIILNRIDYENFITDMRADRAFLEDYAANCSGGDVYYCLLVRRTAADSAVLVLPKDAFVVKAALICGKSRIRDTV